MKRIAQAMVAVALASGVGCAFADDMNDPALKACERLSRANRERCISQVRQDQMRQDQAAQDQGTRTQAAPGSYGPSGSDARTLPPQGNSTTR